MDVNFDRGQAATNGERDCTCDTAFADFDALRWQVSGTATWLAWSQAEPYFDNDPGYSLRIISNVHHQVYFD